MKVNAQNFFAAILLTVGAVVAWPKRKKPSEEDGKSEKYAFVGDPTGEAIFKGAGTELIMRFDQHKYLGILTGEALGEYLEVATQNNANGKWYYFWVRESRIYHKVGRLELTEHLNTGPGLEKTQAEFDRIVEATS